MNGSSHSPDDRAIETCRAEFLDKTFELAGFAGEHIYQAIADSGAPHKVELLEQIAFLDISTEGLIVDVNANIGLHTLALSIAFSNPILAIEPDSANFELLTHNVERNGISGRTTLLEAGLGDQEAVLTLDVAVRGEPVALITIDMESAVEKVVRGSVTTLKRSQPYIAVAAHGPAAYRKLSSLLAELDYEPVLVDSGSDNYVFAHTDVANRARTTLDLLNGRRQSNSSRQLIERLCRDVGAMRERQGSLEAPTERQTEEDQLRAQVEELRNRVRDMARRSRAMETAFRSVSERFELANPGAWSSRQANATFQKHLHHEYRGEQHERGLEHGIPLYRVRELRGPRRSSSDIRIGIATMPGRQEGLKLVLSALSPQADEIMVYLNGMSEVPEGLPAYRNVQYFVGPDFGDRAKFLFLEGFDGYYLTCDDDIAYPSYYVGHVINGIERYGRSAIVGWHGSILNEHMEDYYGRKARTMYPYYKGLEEDTPVHVLGTGAAAMHTSTLPLTFEDFKAPNTADVWLALRAQAMSVPMVVLNHGEGWATPVDSRAPSIYMTARGRVSTGMMNVRQIATDAVKRWDDWKVHCPAPVTGRASISVAIIGSSELSSLRRGGTLASNDMIVEGLRSYGVDVRRFDIHTVGRSDLGEFRPDAVIVDMEDPQRPGYVDVDDLVERHAGEGRLVVVSISGRSDADVVRDKLALWDSQYSNRVRVMGFPETVQSVSVSDEVAHLILPMPKTGHPADQTASFDQRSGIFLGDAATIERLVGDSPHDWISTLRHAVPEAKLYAAQQGEPVRDQVLDVDELWPYSGPELLHRLEAVRLIVSPVRYATYEMVPVEATSIGIPVVYREMPESLSDVLGLSGVRVQTPQELSAVVPLLYRDPALWLSCSRSGNLKAQSQDMRSVAGHLYMGIYRSLAA